MIGANRRRVYKGDSTPVMEIIHPDAIYIKTNEYAAPNGTMMWQYGYNVSKISRLIVDNEEVTPSDYLTQTGINVLPVLSGVHEYYIYPTSSKPNRMSIHVWNTESVVRLTRDNLIPEFSNGGNNIRPLDVIITDASSIPTLSNLYVNTNGNLYLPIEAKSKFDESSVHIGQNGNIFYVKYKFIED